MIIQEWDRSKNMAILDPDLDIGGAETGHGPGLPHGWIFFQKILILLGDKCLILDWFCQKKNLENVNILVRLQP